MTNSKKKFDFSSYAKVVGFFALEVLAIIAFSLGNSFIFYSILSFVLLVLTIVVTIKEFDKDGFASFSFFLFPLMIYGLLSVLSNFVIDPTFILMGPVRFIVPFGLAAIAACGYFSGKIKTFNVRTMMLVIYSALAAITLVNLIITMIQFEPFYTINYRGRYIYYYGKPSESPVSDMAFSLIGFNISEVSVTYFSLFPSLLISAIVPMLWTSPKENKKEFIAYLCFVLLGGLSLLFTINKFTLLTDLLIFVTLLITILFVKLHWKGKPLKLVMIIFGVLFVIAFIIMILNAQLDKGGICLTIRNLIKKSALLDRLFNSNALISKYNAIVDGIFGDKLFGFPHFGKNQYYNYPNGVYASGSFLFDNFMFSGVFGSLFFILAFVIGFRRLFMYYKNSDDSIKEKITIIGFILTFFSYTLINFDNNPYIFSSDTIPMYLSGAFMVVIFLFSYAFSKSNKAIIQEENKEEIVNEIETI